VAEKEARRLMAGVSFADSAREALEGADACVIVTEWPEFAELDWRDVAELMRGEIVIDGRNLLDSDVVRDAGLTYEGIGR
jgi:UDPglucose 6-dehydrogenase